MDYLEGKWTLETDPDNPGSPEMDMMNDFKIYEDVPDNPWIIWKRQNGLSGPLKMLPDNPLLKMDTLNKLLKSLNKLFQRII